MNTFTRFPSATPMRAAVTSCPFTAGYSQSYTRRPLARRPPELSLRGPMTVVAGLNSTDVVNTNSTTALFPASAGTTPDAKYPPARVRQANFTIEQPVQAARCSV